MKQFAIFQHVGRQPEAVKIGFSWPCFFFQWIWGIVKGVSKAVVIFVGILLASIAGQVIMATQVDGEYEGATAVVFLLVNVAFWVAGVWVPFLANAWRRDALREKGYTQTGLIFASNVKAALVQASVPQQGIVAAAGPTQILNPAPPALAETTWAR
jgi:hypothetical protein